MNNKAICLISFRPNDIYCKFLSYFSNYDIYIVVDDNDFDCEYLKHTYKSIHFIKTKENNCMYDGFRNLSFITLHKQVIGWDKGLHYFANINQNYDYVWFIEDDVYFYDENTLLTIDNKYDNIDLLCNSSFEKAKLNEWLWSRIQINFEPPYYCGMMCIVRLSKQMIQSIKDYAQKYNTLFFLEACYPTIAVKYNLSYEKNPEEFTTVTYRNNYNIDSLNKHSLYHPMKTLSNHVLARQK